jgi:lipopolysaccharide/colanic/teichoic acid biosynthesis glycosyltransferase
MTFNQRFVKRAVDIAAAAFGLAILTPLLLPIAAIVRLAMGSPVFFCQQRPGLRGKTFLMWKFRTMLNTLDDRGNLLPDAERLTRIGRFLRRTSLDELPELYNVLRGDMSLVGPRPLLMRYLPYFTLREQLRHTVRPGITGWAQIHGRNEASWNDRLANDVWYVEHWSLLLDVKILVLTLLRAFCQKGVVVDAHSIMKNLDEEREHMVSHRDQQ